MPISTIVIMSRALYSLIFLMLPVTVFTVSRKSPANKTLIHSICILETEPSKSFITVATVDQQSIDTAARAYLFFILPILFLYSEIHSAG